MLRSTKESREANVLY